MRTTFEYCVPKYSGEDNWTYVDAYSAEEAAEKAAADTNEDGDYCLMNGKYEYVLIREETEDDSAPIQAFIMRAEPSIDYYADEVTEVSCTYCKANLWEALLKGNIWPTDGNNFCNYKCATAYRKEEHERFLKRMDEYEAKQKTDKKE
jgi:hypothetical protein